MSYRTLRVRVQVPVCYIQFDRADGSNTIDATLVEELQRALAACGDTISIVVLEGSPEVFCLGADFDGIRLRYASGQPLDQDPEPLYELWRELAGGPYISIAHVRGRANAGGIGFVAACDIAIADSNAQFSLSELLFGLFPACVMPFLARRVGYQKAHYMTLLTQPVQAQQALSWGLVDACDSSSEVVLRKHLMRLRRLSKPAVRRYKRFMSELRPLPDTAKALALAANRSLFADEDNLAGIQRYVETGLFPWEKPGELPQ